MTLKEYFISELREEGVNTKKMLLQVPYENQGFTPHEMSDSLWNIAVHVAGLPLWIVRILEADHFDFSNRLPSTQISSNEQLISYLEENLKKAEEALNQAQDADFDSHWSMKAKEHTIATMPKATAVRRLAFNHTVHHRAQVGLYLRLLNIPVPGMYGPSADDKNKK